MIEAAVTMIVALALAVLGWWGGDRYGVNHQKIADQVQFDKINDGLAKQKADAADQLNKANADIIALQQERAAFNSKLEQQHAQDSAATDAARAELATRSLRFVLPRAKGGASRACGPSPAASQASPASAPGPTYVQLPDGVTNRLRSLMYEADKLKDDYVECKAWIEHG